MATTELGEAIFRRNGWRYRLDEKGDLVTAFGDVDMSIASSPDNQTIATSALVYFADGPSPRQTLQAHGAQVDTFLKQFANRITFQIRNAKEFTWALRRDDSGVLVRFDIPYSGSPEDEGTFVDTVGLATAMAGVLRPYVAAVGAGTLSPQEATDAVMRDVQAQ